ncbi:hypothetical protein BKA66DRAFT_480935 [Pyrenochaeta sp. MPI-SDFR-AT-0127]|nr:hypothetical protein BKA66DRAFT_480935 [Pyrenochaeta sp. MPI-SDFR-AT-0127]
MKPNPSSQLALQAQGDTHFRSIGNLLQKVVTSAWINGPYVIFPTWPNELGKAPLGANFARQAQTWKTEATIYQLDYGCQKAVVNNITAELDSDFKYLEFSTSNDCTYRVDRPESKALSSSDMLDTGGALWGSHVGANLSSHCQSDVDVVFVSTPWQRERINVSVENPGPYSLSWEMVDGSPKPAQNTSILSHICASEYYQAEIPITISISQFKTVVDFNTTLFSEKRSAISEASLDKLSLRGFGMNKTWENYLSGTLHAAQNSNDTSRKAQFGGVGALLGALYDWNVTDMVQQQDIQEQASKIQGRIFGELIHNSINQENGHVLTTSQGAVIEIQRRIIVLPEIAIALIVIIVLSISLLAYTAWATHLGRRPLHLQQDPATVIATASLIAAKPHPCPNIADLTETTLLDADSELQHNRYLIYPDGTLKEESAQPIVDVQDIGSKELSKPIHNRSRDPSGLQVWALLALLSFLVSLVVAILVLRSLSDSNKLYRTAFVYQATIHAFKSVTFAPFPILPTLLAIGVSLWWDMIYKTFRRLQPLLAMCRRESSIKGSSGLSYQSSYVGWTAAKAAMHRHWLLGFVALGSVACQLLVISMSALFERESDTLLNTMQVDRAIEPRQLPFLHSDTFDDALLAFGRRKLPGRIVANTFSHLQSNWMYSATIQLALDGTEPSWSKDGWSFTPASFRALPDAANSTKIQNVGENVDEHGIFAPSVNITLETSAIRGRLECSPLDEDIANVSSWLETVRFERFSNSTKGPVTNSVGYDLTPNMFTHNSTSPLTHPGRLACCLNSSQSNEQGTVAIGYWSTNNGKYYPHSSAPWPINMTVKWIHGSASPWPADIEFLKDKEALSGYTPNQSSFMFSKVPVLQAMNCEPIIERAEAKITVDFETGNIQSYSITSQPQPAPEAWSDPFVLRQVRSKVDIERKIHYDEVDANVTTSYGVLFMDALLGAADLPQIEGYSTNVGGNILGKRLTDTSEQSGNNVLLETSYMAEDVVIDDTFKIRDRLNGLNMDIMSYAMLKQANGDPEALLNFTTMLSHAQHTFSTFFQHFASMNARPNATFGAYQDIDDNSLEEVLASNKSQRFAESGSGSYFPEFKYEKLNTSRTLDATVTTRIEFLRMNKVATWISIACLAWLISISLAVLILKHSYFSHLLYDVESLAEFLVLVAGSESLLKLVRDNDVKLLQKSKTHMTKLGWFRAPDGAIRWGVEVVGDVGLGAVEWVEK